MPIGGKLRMLKGVLYKLKRGYGCKLDVYKSFTHPVDLETGRSLTDRLVVHVERAVVLPSQIHRGFNYDIGYLKANSNFTYGGIYTDSTRVVYIDAVDLPKDFGLNATDSFYVVYEGNRWEIKAVEKFEQELGFIVTLERVDGAITDQIIEITVRERLQFHQYETYDDGDEQSALFIDETLQFAQTVIVGPITVHHQKINHKLSFLERAGRNA